jgi:hypothetical protein
MSIIGSILNKVIRIFENAPPEDYTVKLPVELKRCIASLLSNPLDLLVLANVNRKWRIVVNDVCQARIQAFFGDKLTYLFQEKKEPRWIAWQLWGPFGSTSTILWPQGFYSRHKVSQRL